MRFSHILFVPEPTFALVVRHFSLLIRTYRRLSNSKKFSLVYIFSACYNSYRFLGLFIFFGSVIFIVHLLSVCFFIFSIQLCNSEFLRVALIFFFLSRLLLRIWDWCDGSLEWWEKCFPIFFYLFQGCLMLNSNGKVQTLHFWYFFGIHNSNFQRLQHVPEMIGDPEMIREYHLRIHESRSEIKNW